MVIYILLISSMLNHARKTRNDKINQIFHAAKPSTVSHVISERHWKSTIEFTEIVNNDDLKRGTLCQIVRFIY